VNGDAGLAPVRRVVQGPPALEHPYQKSLAPA
jgi:hypothetical protein